MLWIASGCGQWLYLQCRFFCSHRAGAAAFTRLRQSFDLLLSGRADLTLENGDYYSLRQTASKMFKTRDEGRRSPADQPQACQR
ncbi:hypothetical protein ACF2JD_02740 [Aeromonas sp. A-5]|uniref:hypothetical protein n=1 Tax=Aeromonas ichthyocola TaxID=3367746 RepID=UPI0038EA8402